MFFLMHQKVTALSSFAYEIKHVFFFKGKATLKVLIGILLSEKHERHLQDVQETILM